MATDLSIDRKRTAVVIMDYQVDLVGSMPDLLERAAAVLEAARSAGLPIFYVTIRFREGYPEIGTRNKTFAGIKERGFLKDGVPGSEVHPRVAPRPEDVVVVKRRIGPFSTTELDLILRCRDLTTLILLGYATSGVVLSTVRWAADIDYDLVVVDDCCADGDEEVHRVLMYKIFPRHGAVVSSEQLIAALSG